MRGMILAAGLGARLGSLTQSTPKPLIQLKGRYLIEYPLYSLIAAGIKEIVINVSYRADEIKQALGEGERYGVKILYSYEKNRLETGGGIVNALPLLGDDPFFVTSSDIVTDFPIQRILKPPKDLAHLVLIDNPKYHPQGDFGLDKNNYVDRNAKLNYTFSNLAVYQKEFFSRQGKPCAISFFPLNELLFPAIDAGKVTGEYYQGLWHNIGSYDDLLRAQSDLNIPVLK